LNYGYGILYNEVERAVLFAGLDPHVGMLHSDRYGKPSLVLDLVEEFRVPIIDAVILPLFANTLFERRDFVHSGRRIMLGLSGRRKIVREVFTRLHHRVLWKKRRSKLSDIITSQSQELARSLLRRTRYTPFIATPSLYEKSISPDRHLVEEFEPKKKYASRKTS
ncbi:MAG: CRISPR-associated endonuclease Cas1, partial [Candidatus Shapirobacteria bacterium]